MTRRLPSVSVAELHSRGSNPVLMTSWTCLLSTPSYMTCISKLKGTGSRFSACSLIKLHFSNLLLILSVNNPTHMYLSDLRVYFKVEVYFTVT